ncbi:MAG TPA: hydroxysqualene dehydroxylase HpnE [Nitrospirota bacterium]|nr:hydroxysqualene dehydroxylase HpnE [Nitrospirota bacterium]
MKKVIVIGGGFAGLAAATELSSAGFHVTLIEQRRFLGGRAYSFLDKDSGLEFDNGQHILMGCYENTFRFLDKIGVTDKLYFQKNLCVDFLDTTGTDYRLNCLPLPAPLHILSGILRFKAISLTERIRMLNMAKGVLFGNATNTAHDVTITEWLKRLGQGKKARETLWDIITLATMNEHPDKSSAAIFRNVMKKAFFSLRRNSRIVLPVVPLSSLFADNAETYIRQNGGSIEKGTAVSALLTSNNSISGVKLKDGRVFSGEYFISAVPYYSVQKLFAGARLLGTELNSVPALKPSPIISIHLLFNKSLTEFTFAALLNSPIQWVFNKEKIFRDAAYKGLLSLVISGAHHYIEVPSEKLVELALSELKKVIPATSTARILCCKVIKERHATFSPQPGVDKFRPSQKTPIKNLFLAGDWTDTGLPATIEGAVLSGHKCAMAITSN